VSAACAADSDFCAEAIDSAATELAEASEEREEACADARDCCAAREDDTEAAERDEAAAALSHEAEREAIEAALLAEEAALMASDLDIDARDDDLDASDFDLEASDLERDLRGRGVEGGRREKDGRRESEVSMMFMSFKQPETGIRENANKLDDHSRSRRLALGRRQRRRLGLGGLVLLRVVPLVQLRHSALNTLGVVGLDRSVNVGGEPPAELTRARLEVVAHSGLGDRGRSERNSDQSSLHTRSSRPRLKECSGGGE
jgi:hypothetical protein